MMKSLLTKCIKYPISGLAISSNMMNVELKYISETINIFLEMVHITRICLGPRKTGQQWIDSIRIYARGGHGGAGLPRVNGAGGAGGDVYVKADVTVKDLSEVRRKNTKQRYLADHGENSV